MLVLFENLTLVCMLVIEAFQSSIAFTFLSYEIPKELGGLFLQRFLIAAGRATPYTGVELEEGPEVCHMYIVEQVGALSVICD